ncbi:heterokaryon incompatibility protein-domain-containing protein [Rhexocercosporidium sp. MPI-PUGE-AT-0058]|nr:heterokaryon incompatibility protein-domain-containing protein [Rhexocercosporidium sp. MPI-PUGE-AT-0058]
MSAFHNGRKPLFEPLDTIRLLQMPWGKGASTFDGDLVPFALQTSPDFVALSYTWGTEMHTQPLSINGHDFYVTENLYSFLRRIPDLPEFSPDTWWWVDAICINQNDVKEKNSQMAIMGKIYESATQTVVWLGEENDAHFGEESRDCRYAIENLYRLCDEMERASGNDKAANRAAMEWLRDPKSGLDWGAVRGLLLRPWWRRVWTLQEFLISDRSGMRFYCGRNSISRHDLESAIYATWLCKGWDPQLLGKEAHEAGWNRRRMSQWYNERKYEMGLVAMLAYVGDSGVTNAEDRIYSLLGIAKDAHLVGSLDPGSSVEQVYTSLVKTFIQPEHYDSLDIICYSHLFNHDARNSEDERILPSWVPDWRAHVEGKVVPVMASQGSSEGTGNFRPTWVRNSKVAYRASGSTKPIFTIDPSNNTLTCAGVVIDTIDGLGGSKYDDAGEAIESLPLQQPTSDSNLASASSIPSKSVLEVISRCLALDRKDRYLSETMAPDLFYDDFLKFCKAYFRRPASSKVPVYFRDWFNTNRSLLINGRALEDHCREVTKDMAVPEAKFFREGSLRKFYGRLNDTVITMARRLAVTEKGYLGMAASRARRGDLVCVLLGCSIPVLLRPVGEDTFELVGECYLDGFMDGEAVHGDSGLVRREFRIL